MFLTSLLFLCVLNNPCIILNQVLCHDFVEKKIHFQLILNQTERHFISLLFRFHRLLPNLRLHFPRSIPRLMEPPPCLTIDTSQSGVVYYTAVYRILFVVVLYQIFQIWIHLSKGLFKVFFDASSLALCCYYYYFSTEVIVCVTLINLVVLEY